MNYSVEIGGSHYVVEVHNNSDGGMTCQVNGGVPVVVHASELSCGDWVVALDGVSEQIGVGFDGNKVHFQRQGQGYIGKVSERENDWDFIGGGKEENEVTSSMPGVITAVMVSKGDSVVEGQVLLVVEAMKMQNEFTAPFNGVVREVHVKVNETIDGERTLVSLTPEGE